MDVVITFFIAVFLGVASVYDTKTGRIPNILNLVMCFAGVGYSQYRYGLYGLMHSIFGVILPIGLLFFLYTRHFIGAGDVKLFAALGAWIWEKVIWIMISSFFVIALYALVRIVMRFIKALVKIRTMGVREEFIREAFVVTRVRLSIFILIGTALCGVGGILYGL